MDKAEIIKKIETIADKAKDDQVKLNALSYLLNRFELKEKEEEMKIEDQKFKEKTKERFESLIKAFE